MKGGSPAWLLDCGGGTIVATGFGNVLHVIEDMRLLYKVPLAPLHCNQVLLWQGRLLPAINLTALIEKSPRSVSHSFACVMGWSNRRGETEFGVLLVQGLPRQISIADTQQAQPTDKDIERWRGIAVGFFDHHNQSTPIVDPSAIFDSESSVDASIAAARSA